LRILLCAVFNNLDKPYTPSMNFTQFILENVLNIAMWAISGGMLIGPVLQRKTMGESVNVDGAVALMNRDNAVLLDVRDAAAFGKGRVAQAKSTPFADLETRAAEFVKQACVIIMDADGKQAAKAAKTLRAAGAPRVVVLEGGFAAWTAAGLPVKK
jgi:rhodanese-related sulfurtransferase